MGDANVLAHGGAVLATIVAVSALHASPTIIYHLSHDDDPPSVGERQPFESEFYSLRPTQLILPLASHRLEPFAELRETYDQWSESTGIRITEAALSSLGTIGSLGFLGLVGLTLASAIPGRLRRPPPLLRAAGVATVVALLIATMGGFSSLIGLLYPQLRAWNRLSIFIAFFALLAVGVALDRGGRRLSRIHIGRPLFVSLLVVIFIVGVLDQTSPRYAPDYEATTTRYHSDRTFVRRIEGLLPNDAAVFQLPYASFPEYNPPPPGRTVVYDLLQPYLHSKELRWSFGAIRGTAADWTSRLDEEPLAEVVAGVSAVGFDGIYVDRFGYATDAEADEVERRLTEIIGSRPIRNDEGRLVFFDLRGYNEILRSQLSAPELAALRARVLSAS
jgi:phosphoglycerol transferase